MHYEGEPNHPMPAPNFEAFNAVFRKKRRELLEQFERLRKLESAYVVSARFMENLCLREVQAISIFENVVAVNVSLNEHSLLDEFTHHAMALGRELRTSGLHGTGEGSMSVDTFIGVRRTWVWYLTDGRGRLTFNVSVPDKGCADYMVIKTIRHYPSEEHELVKRPDVISVVDLYTRIAGEVRFTREEVKLLAHGLSWDGDPAQLLDNLGYEFSEELLAEVLKVKELLYAEARSPTAHREVRSPDVSNDVREEHPPQEVLQPEVPGSGEGPVVPTPQKEETWEDDQERTTPR